MTPTYTDYIQTCRRFCPFSTRSEPARHNSYDTFHRGNRVTGLLLPELHPVRLADRNAFAAANELGTSRPGFRLYFNLSGRQAGDPKLIRAFTDAMRDVEATRRVCRALRRLNVRIAIDDFGRDISRFRPEATLGRYRERSTESHLSRIPQMN